MRFLCYALRFLTVLAVKTAYPARSFDDLKLVWSSVASKWRVSGKFCAVLGPPDFLRSFTCRNPFFEISSTKKVIAFFKFGKACDVIFRGRTSLKTQKMNRALKNTPQCKVSATYEKMTRSYINLNEKKWQLWKRIAHVWSVFGHMCIGKKSLILSRKSDPES